MPQFTDQEIGLIAMLLDTFIENSEKVIEKGGLVPSVEKEIKEEIEEAQSARDKIQELHPNLP